MYIYVEVLYIKIALSVTISEGKNFDFAKVNDKP